MPSAGEKLVVMNKCVKHVAVCQLIDLLVFIFDNMAWIFPQFFSLETTQFQFREKIIYVKKTKHNNYLISEGNMCILIGHEIDLLTAACEANKIVLVISLIQKFNCNINVSDTLGWTPLRGCLQI